MLAAASFKPYGVDAAVDPLGNEPWELEASRGPSQHTMKLLDLDIVRSLMLRNLDVCRKGSPTLNDARPPPYVPETDSDLQCGATGVADPSDVNRLLALDIEELVRHTCSVQRERRNSADVGEKSQTAGFEHKRRTNPSTGGSSKHRAQSSLLPGRNKARRKRRRPFKRTSSSPSGSRPTVLRHRSSVRMARNESIRATPLRLGLPASDVQRMNAALRSAGHDAQLLGDHLKRALGKRNELLSESVARTTTTSLLAQGDTHGDLDTERALRLSRLAPPPSSSATTSSTAQDVTGNGMDIEGGGSTAAAVGRILGEPLLLSSPRGQLASTRVPSPQETVGLDDAKNLGVVADRPLGGGQDPASADESVVDRRRLIAILEAEERISAMANHLGSADSITNLRSLLLPEQLSCSSWFSRSPTGASGGHEPQKTTTSSSSMDLRESSATAPHHPSGNDTGGFPTIGRGPHPSRGKEKPAGQKKQRRSRSVEEPTLSSSMVEAPWDDAAAHALGTRLVPGEKESLGSACGSNHGRKKRSREGEVAGQSEDLSWLGRAPSFLDGAPMSGLARSGSFTTNQRPEMSAPEAGVAGNSSCFSLPKLKASRLSRSGKGRHTASDDYDHFGGRETPTVLRRNSLSGGGEDSKRAVEELRQQLEITEGGLLDLRARVRADVAWVQETVGAKMSRRARASCCKWGSEKIAELTHRWEGRSLGKAVATWTRHREYMANRDLVRAFLKRKGAAQARRLLTVWGRRLTSRALEEWRRRVRLERRAEETAAASKLQTAALGFLGRRLFQRALVTRGAIRIQKVARGGACRRRAGRAREGVRRNDAARKIQDQVRKREERRRAQRIVALRRRRRAAVKIQKCARGFLGRRKASIRRETLLRQRVSVAIQAAWRGLLGRRRASQVRGDLEAVRAAQNKAAVHIQAAQRRKAAMGAADTRRRVKALQRRESVKIAVVSIQRVVRGRAARATVEAEVARREERQRAAAAVHIQRVARGRVARARKVAASTSASPDVPVLPAPPARTSPEQNIRRDGEEGDGFASSSSDGFAEATNGGNLDNDAAESSGDGGDEKHLEGAGAAPDPLAPPAEAEAEVEACDKQGLLASSADGPSAGGVISEREEAARDQAASKIQAVGRGRAARSEALDRKRRRSDEEARRASVWGRQPQQEEKEESSSSRPPKAASRASSASPTAAAARLPPPRSSSLFSADGPGSSSRGKAKATGSRGEPEAATRIQAAFRGGRARWEADQRREEFQRMGAEAKARSQEKRERDAAVQIQTQARARAARATRERHHQRHAARVGSIRDSGRAAADDLRALSRPGTAVAVAVAGGGGGGGSGGEGGAGEEEMVSAWDGAAEALLPISVGLLSMGSMGPAVPTEPGWGTVAPHSGGGSGSFSLPAAIGVVAVRSPSSVGSPSSETAAAAAAAAAGSTAGNTASARHSSNAQAKGRSGRSRTSAVGRVSGGQRPSANGRKSSHAASSPGGGGNSSVSPADRSRSRSVASPRRTLSPARSAPGTHGRSPGSPGSSGAAASPAQTRRSVSVANRKVSGRPKRPSSASGGGAGGGGAVVEMSLKDVERAHIEMKKGIENELHRELREKIEKELAAKLAAQEEERERVSREAEEERKRDRDALEEAMRAVREAHSKDAEEIARIKARLEDEETARRAEHDAGRQEYERSLAEIRAEALAEAEKGRLAAEAVEKLRREVEKESQEQRRRQEEADAQIQAREQAERAEKERRMEEDQAKPNVRHIHSKDANNWREGSYAVVAGGGQDDGQPTSEDQKQHEKEAQERLKQQELEAEQKTVMQQLAAENVERQRVALVQLQAQLREEETKRLESHAAWEARQAEEEEIAKEERRSELEAIESLKRQLEEDKIRAYQEQELRNAEVRLQMESLRALQEKVQEQERVRLEAEKAAQAEQKAKEDAVVREGAELMKEDDLDFDDDKESDNVGEEAGSGGGGGGSANSSRPKSTGTFGSSRGTSAGMLAAADVEEAVKREIESATGSRLAQVEGALLELARKQAELESREKQQFDETVGAYLGAPASPADTALVSATTAGTGAVDAFGGGETGDAAVATTAVTTGVEWVEYWDESAGASYFFNTVTQEASWTNPHEVAAGGGSVDAGGAAGAGGVEGGGGGRETLSQPEDGRAKWTECLDEVSGSTYYYNVITGEAVWERPAELSRKSEAVAGVPQFERPEEWVCYLDENSGEEYWFNVTTGETHWGGT